MKAVLLAALLAYIPGTNALLRKAAARGAQLGRTRDVTLTGTLLEGQGPARAATLTMHFPASCALTAGDASYSVHGGVAEGAGGPVVELLKMACPLLTTHALPSSDAVATFRGLAAAAGIEFGVTALSRLADRVVYVLGAAAREPQKPQLWLYKDGTAPARVIAANGADLRFLQYGDPAAAEWFPRIIELWQNGQLTARFETLEAAGVRPAGEDDEDSAASE